MRAVLLALLVMGLPAAGWAGTWSKNCATPTNANRTISPNESGCYTFTSTDSTTGDSAAIFIDGTSAKWCFDPDTSGTATTTARVLIRDCLGGAKPSSNPENECISLGGANGNASLDGTEGAASSQNACIRTGPGVFYVDITAACTGSACRVSVQAEP